MKLTRGPNDRVLSAFHLSMACLGQVVVDILTHLTADTKVNNLPQIPLTNIIPRLIVF